MPVASLFAMALGFVVAAIGVLGVVAPSILLEFGRLLQSTNALYVVAAARIMFGVILFWAAPNSRTPRTLRILGLFLIIAGVITPFFGVERSRAMFDWWSTQASLFMRAWPFVAIVFGLFVAFAVLPRQSAR